jgi:hypothetical protein
MAALAAEALKHLSEGDFYSRDVVDATFQKWERDLEITLIDAFGFMHVWSYYLRGDLACCSVPLPSGPGRDRELAFNQSILDQLPKGFQATFSPERGRGANSDGSFTIEKGIGLWRNFWKEEASDLNEEPWFFAEDHTIALEVGTTSVSKTLEHLRRGRGVARWPYGYNKIIVLAGVKTNAFQNAIEAHNQAKGT